MEKKEKKEKRGKDRKKESSRPVRNDFFRHNSSLLSRLETVDRLILLLLKCWC